MKKKGYTGILVSLIIALMVLSGCSQGSTPATTEESNFLTFTSEAYGVSIDYAPDWTKNDQAEGFAAVFLSPQESASDAFRENLIVLVQDLSAQPMTLEEFTTLSLGQIEQGIPGAEILDSSSTTLNGLVAHKLVYTATQEQYDLKFMVVWAVTDNAAYVLTYTAEMAEYDEYLAVVQKMIDSFEAI